VAIGLDDALWGWLVASAGDSLVRRLRGDPAKAALREVVEEAIAGTVDHVASGLDHDHAAHLRASLRVHDFGFRDQRVHVTNKTELRDAVYVWIAALDHPEYGEPGYLTGLGLTPGSVADALTSRITDGIQRNGRGGGVLNTLAEWLWRDALRAKVEEIKESLARRPAERDLLDALGPPAPPPSSPGRIGGWRRPVVSAVTAAIAAGERRIVLYGLPRTGKDTIIADALDGGSARDGVVLSTAVVEPEGETGAWLIPVPPLSREESRSLLEYEIDRHGIQADADHLLRLLPAGPMSMPGGLRAYVAELRHTPPELLAAMPLPATVAAEIAPVAARVAALSAADLSALVNFALLGGVPFARLLDAGLVDSETSGPALRLLTARCLVYQSEGQVEVPAVVLDGLGPEPRSAAARQIADRIGSLARARVEPALAVALPVLAGNWLALGVFDQLDVPALIERLNRQGYWDAYVALTRVLIDALDERDDLPNAVSARCRLARKVAQQGDLEHGWSLLREADALVGADGPAAARAELHSHRAFLAHLQGDSAYALEELHCDIALRSAIDDPVGLLMAHKFEGNIRLRAGEYEAATECFAAALAIDAPGAEGPHLEAEVSLAQCELRLDRLEVAGERLDRVIEQMRAGLVRTELPRALWVTALLAEQGGLPARALDLARQAAESDVRDPAVKAQIERTIWRLERFGGLYTGRYPDRRGGESG
jgi:tetratricopeptide (TPR) repeat protein